MAARRAGIAAAVGVSGLLVAGIGRRWLRAAQPPASPPECTPLGGGPGQEATAAAAGQTPDSAEQAATSTVGADRRGGGGSSGGGGGGGGAVEAQLLARVAELEQKLSVARSDPDGASDGSSRETTSSSSESDDGSSGGGASDDGSSRDSQALAAVDEDQWSRMSENAQNIFEAFSAGLDRGPQAVRAPTAAVQQKP